MTTGLWNLTYFSCFLQIGHLKKGLNPPSLTMLGFNGSYLGLALKTGLVTGLISLTVFIISTFYFDNAENHSNQFHWY
jgi:sulfate transporter 3